LSVDLRFSNVDPPAPEPKRSIYSDLVNLPDPVRLGLTVRIFNADIVTLWMRVDASLAGWTFTTFDLGGLGAGLDMYRNLDNFGSRAKPAAALSETIVVRLRAYTDSGYTNLKWTVERNIDVVFIKSNDGSWTQDFLDNFNDGTVQGWAVTAEVGTIQIVAGATDYFLSAPYALRVKLNYLANQTLEHRGRLYKTFVTPNRANVFAIADLFIVEYDGQMGGKNIQLKHGDNVLVFIGRPYYADNADYITMNKWIRIVAPLPPNTSVEIRVILDIYVAVGDRRANINFDDFRIISKD